MRLLIFLTLLSQASTTWAADLGSLVRLTETRILDAQDQLDHTFCRGIAIAPNTVLTSLHCMIDEHTRKSLTHVYIENAPIRHVAVDPQSHVGLGPQDTNGDFVILYPERPSGTPIEIIALGEVQWSKCHFLIDRTEQIEVSVTWAEQETSPQTRLGRVNEPLQRGDSGSPLFCEDLTGRPKLAGLLQAIGPVTSAGEREILIQRLDIFSDWIHAHLK